MSASLSSVIVHSLVYGTVLSVLLSLMVIWSLWFNPEMWVHDAPREVREKYGPISARSKRQRTIFVIPFFLVLIGLPWRALQQVPAVTGQSYTFQTVFVTLFVMLMLFNLVDLLVLDWWLIETWRPDFLRQSRLGMLMAGHDYRFHFVGFCKGSIGITLVSLLVAGIMAMLG